jgi:hypothetical protein
VVLVLDFRQLIEVRSHPAHETGEGRDVAEQGGILKILKNFLPVAHGVDVAQMAEQDLRDQLALVALTRDSRHNLVEVQIPCERAILLVFLLPGILLLPGRAGRRC